MNTTANRPGHAKTGFTLVELLVTILIIAILLSLIFPAISALRRAAMIRKAGGQGIQISNSLKEYRTAYGKWPAQNQGLVDRTYVGAAQAAIITALTNNPRTIDFIEIPEGVMRDSGPLKGCYMDPWGSNAYVIAMDENNDGTVKITAANPLGGPSIDKTISNQTVAVMSWGQNPANAQNRRIGSWDL